MCSPSGFTELHTPSHWLFCYSRGDPLLVKRDTSAAYDPYWEWRGSLSEEHDCGIKEKRAMRDRRRGRSDSCAPGCAFFQLSWSWEMCQAPGGPIPRGSSSSLPSLSPLCSQLLLFLHSQALLCLQGIPGPPETSGSSLSCRGLSPPQPEGSSVLGAGSVH